MSNGEERTPAMNDTTTTSRCALAAGSARLANDIARCNGSGSIEDGVQYWREGCEHCLRRTAARPELVWMMAPPPIIAFECEYFLPPNKVM